MLEEVLAEIQRIIDEEHRDFIGKKCHYCDMCKRPGELSNYSCPDCNRWLQRYVLPRIKEVLKEDEYIKE